MKIKNKRELVLRARGHARQDHIKQGTYGDATSNGKATYEGCAIGCLATPHRQADLQRLCRNEGFNGGDDTFYFRTSREWGLEHLRKQFGISPLLARMAEAVFENLPTHGAAIEFIPAFAKALPEGVDIRPDRLIRWWEGNVGGYATKGPYLPIVDGPSQSNAVRTRDAFLDWLRSLS